MVEPTQTETQVEKPATEYAEPNVLVTTEWLAENLTNPTVRILEIDVDPTKAFELGHIKGAALIDWGKDLNDPVKRDVVDKKGFEALLSKFGVTKETTVVLYGDFNNWFAAFGFWLFKIYGFEDVKLLNGGRKKWADEEREYVTETSTFTPSEYTAEEPDWSLRTYLPQVKNIIGKPDWGLVDVRSEPEFTGEITAPPELTNEGARVGGHIPGAQNISWSKAVNEDGTFKSRQELEELYNGYGITSDKSIVAYCRIGERSSHSWFVLKYLLGFKNVVNYDGSWSEWGNAVGVPVEK